MIDDSDLALRLVWNSSDFNKSGALKGSAFASGDLIPSKDDRGHARYVSMDLFHTISQKSVDWMIARAGAGSAPGREKRIEAQFAEFLCGDLSKICTDSGDIAFALRPYPLAANDLETGSPENLAHIGVCSVTPVPDTDDEKTLKVQELRTKILDCRRNTLKYIEVFDPA